MLFWNQASSSGTSCRSHQKTFLPTLEQSVVGLRHGIYYSVSLSLQKAEQKFSLSAFSIFPRKNEFWLRQDISEVLIIPLGILSSESTSLLTGDVYRYHCIACAYISLFRSVLAILRPADMPSTFRLTFFSIWSQALCLFHWDFTFVVTLSKLGCSFPGLHHFLGFWSTMQLCHIYSLLHKIIPLFWTYQDVFFF